MVIFLYTIVIYMLTINEETNLNTNILPKTRLSKNAWQLKYVITAEIEHTYQPTDSLGEPSIESMFRNLLDLFAAFMSEK